MNQKPKCPKCKSESLMVERRPDGDAICTKCKWSGPYDTCFEREFPTVDDVVDVAVDVAAGIVAEAVVDSIFSSSDCSSDSSSGSDWSGGGGDFSGGGASGSFD